MRRGDGVVETLGLSPVAAVKIDVEGLEAVVIAELAKTASVARVQAIFYEVDDRWASAGEIETLLRGAGFTRFAKYGRGHHYDVLASRS